MRASGPTARPAHASPHLIDADLDAALPGGFLLRRSDPTDPLVSRQRGDIGPKARGSGVKLDGFSEICWQLMDRAVREFLIGHTPKRVRSAQRERDKPRQGVVANTLNLFRDGAVGFIDWFDLQRTLVLSQFLADIWISLHIFQAGSQSVNFWSVYCLIFYIQHIDRVRE